MLHIGHQREELEIDLEGQKLTQGDRFVYLGGAVCGDQKTGREIRRRAQAGANAWRAVEVVMADRRLSKRLRKIARVTRAYRRRMVVLMEQTIVQRSLTVRLVRSRLQRAGHVEWMAGDRLSK